MLKTPERVAGDPKLMGAWRAQRSRHERQLGQLRRAMYYHAFVVLASSAPLVMLVYYAGPRLLELLAGF